MSSERRLHLITSHVECKVDHGSPDRVAGIRNKIRELIRHLEQNRVGVPPSLEFIDSAPNERHSGRVARGKRNEEIAKAILRLHNVEVEDVPKSVDVGEKIDFYIKGAFGRLGVQFKGRNRAKRSKRSDVGIEYSQIHHSPGQHKWRIAVRGKGLVCEIGRDRNSVADIYLSVDQTSMLFHWMPAADIEMGGRLIHKDVEVEIEHGVRSVTNSSGGTWRMPYWQMKAINRTSGRVFQRGEKSLCLRNADVGEIRYFKPYNSKEGVIKSMLYLNEKFTGEFDYQLQRVPAPIPQPPPYPPPGYVQKSRKRKSDSDDDERRVRARSSDSDN